MFYYLYQITNAVNNKIYVGVHKTKSLDDGYMGSGKIIRSAIAKHGSSNFSKVILEYFDTSKAMYAKEKEIITDEFLQREDVYNIRRGGAGGFDHINKSRDFSDHNKKIAKIRDYTSKEYLEKLSIATKLGQSKVLNKGSKPGRAPTIGTTGKTWTVSNRKKWKQLGP